jgi:hypothetical protein
MVNGKPFFDKDGKIALKNLPADIIKNIQFTTTKTKEEELTGKTLNHRTKPLISILMRRKTKAGFQKFLQVTVRINGMTKKD